MKKAMIGLFLTLTLTFAGGEFPEPPLPKVVSDYILAHPLDKSIELKPASLDASMAEIRAEKGDLYLPIELFPKEMRDECLEYVYSYTYDYVFCLRTR